MQAHQRSGPRFQLYNNLHTVAPTCGVLVINTRGCHIGIMFDPPIFTGHTRWPEDAKCFIRYLDQDVRFVWDWEIKRYCARVNAIARKAADLRDLCLRGHRAALWGLSRRLEAAEPDWHRIKCVLTQRLWEMEKNLTRRKLHE
jgi:hypothetical protein